MREAPVNFSLLHKTCSLVVLLCFLHISVTIIYYMRNSDSRQAFIQNQQNPQFHRKLAEQTVTTEESSLPSVSNVTETVKKLETCPDNPPRLVGPLRVEFSDPVTLDLVRSENPGLQPGGRFKPADCIAQQKVAIIIPFRNRDEHLKYWLYYLHPILQRQQLDYGVYVINQATSSDSIVDFVCSSRTSAPQFIQGSSFEFAVCYKREDCCSLSGARGLTDSSGLLRLRPSLNFIAQAQVPPWCSSEEEKGGEETFNRAKLLNVGYAEALKEYDYNCFVFSDVDLIPMDDRNIYKCYNQPRHLSVSMDKFGFRLPYVQYFGGVSSLSKEQYLKINGFPNNYWGWGGEDDDIFNRVSSKGMSISRPDGMIGRCRMIRHERDKQNDPNPQRGLDSFCPVYQICSAAKGGTQGFQVVLKGRPCSVSDTSAEEKDYI
ncbi:Beta-1,4-galactosyltransferase 1 [Labeo rohita]|uniref:Beta-1,4-galactosyltransferase n=2 Tax=Labeonini TaxID=2743697 RepID=A0ABQ8M2C7_LABRO|nr:Beta-1,4-galactosyltransferase 1 [Labeo rohita]